MCLDVYTYIPVQYLERRREGGEGGEAGGEGSKEDISDDEEAAAIARWHYICVQSKGHSNQKRLNFLKIQGRK